MELVGVLANAPDLKFTPSGRAVANFLLYIEREPARKIVVWQELAEKISKAVEKGDKIKAFGHLSINRWKEGSEEKSEEVLTAYRVQLLEKCPKEVVSQLCCRLCTLFTKDCSHVCYDALNEMPTARLCSIDRTCVVEEDNKECFVGRIS